MTISTLPLTSDVSQQFTCQLGENKLQFDVRFNDRQGVWLMAVTDVVTDTKLVDGVAILLGTELLHPFNLSLGYLVAIDEDGTNKDAGADDLGSRVNVYWVSADEVS